ncbi:hypothetical protein AMR72_07005 [Flavobacterium psychrophilum]|nr:hypothetical protein AMR72_07005 [Flavobacterium psychrophilum]AOE52278.1 hypothetical protein ALW18_06995 [Flavobacterium psychrophilum]
MKTLKILALLCCFVAHAQENNEIQFKNVDEIRYYERVLIEAGMRVPLDKLGDKISISPEVGMWFRSRLRNGDLVDVGGSIYVPSAAKYFDYEDRGAVYQVKPTGVSGMAGVRLNKVYALESIRYKKSIDWISSFGYAWFSYRDNYAPNTSQENSSLKAFSTFHLGQGVRFNIDNIGFQLSYNYTPYGQFSKHVQSDFGAHSLSFGINYRQ